MKINILTPLSARENVLNNAYLMGISSTRNWFEKILNLRIGVPESTRINRRQFEKYKNSMLKMFDIYKGHYKEYFDVQIVDGTILFKILYPEFTISNSEGRSHLIKDLIVVHSFAYNPVEGHVYPARIQGMRLTRTSEEIYTGYKHSHLHSSSSSEYRTAPFSIGTFCIGNETDLSLLEAEFEVMMDYERIELYLFVIDSMVQWESLEGVPYIRMSSIYDENFKTVTNINVAYANRVVQHIEENRLTLDVDFYYAEGRYKIKPNKKASDFIKKIVLEILLPEQYECILTLYSPSLKSFLGLSVEDTVRSAPEVEKQEGEIPFTFFNGVKRYCKAIEMNPEKRKNKRTPIEDYIIYPEFLNYVTRKLEERLFKKTSTSSAIAYCSAISNT